MWTVFLLICLAFKASASQITGNGNTSADYGGEAHYKCQLDDSKDVLQVTWQRLFKDDSIENLATYSKRFGEQVNEPYRGKIIFTEASLRSTSITVKNLTWADESCYVCSFNAYPDGSKRHQTCLRVEGVSQVKTQVYAPTDDPKDEDINVVFSCSATGKPYPQIKWDYSPQATVVDQSQSSVWTNSDRTFTRSRNITLQLPPDWDGHVHCLINPGMGSQKRETITFSRRKTTEKDEETHLNKFTYIVLSVLLILSFIIAVVLIVKKKRQKQTQGACVV